ncbi:hypothetical protein H3222_22365 [Pseudomonas chengduensis]|jgi:Mor family transcriptional regulator|nr:Mor transcription activator family protein [Pseudomonas chengduensis]MBG0847945.1 hypothetical protein [Pseudomonas chengduensis]
MVSVASTERMARRRNDLFADMADRAMHVLKKYGLDDSQAQDAADDLVDELAENWGGQYITVPKGLSYRSAKRRQAIIDGFDGSNHSELATEHRLSVNYIYKILKSAQAK